MLIPMFGSEFKAEFWKVNHRKGMTEDEWNLAIYYAEHALGCVGFDIRKAYEEEFLKYHATNPDSVHVLDRVLSCAVKCSETDVLVDLNRVSEVPLHEILHECGVYNEELTDFLAQSMLNLAELSEEKVGDFVDYCNSILKYHKFADEYTIVE